MCYQKAVRGRYASVISDALHEISQNYVETVDSRELFDGAMDGLVQSLDQYSEYISPSEFMQFRESLDQEFGGIGIVVELNQQTRRLTILSPLVGTPAYESGMRSGDVIVEIDGESTEGYSLTDAVKKMRGEPGSEVQLTIFRPGENKDMSFTIRRAIIPVESVLGDRRKEDRSWQFSLEKHPRIGYLRLTTFGDQTEKELRKAIESWHEPSEGIIIDLRWNSGGLLTAAVAVCDMFLNSGTIVSTRGRNGIEQTVYVASARQTVAPNVPLVVLVSRFSASASEIVAACLQDHGRATIIGQRTWGKGTVQNIIPLEGGESALKITTATYWRPSGKNIHRLRKATEEADWGVKPNVGFEIILTDEEYRAIADLRQRREFSLSKRASKSEGTDTAENEGDTTSDVQLKRAVEHIQAQHVLNQKAA